MKKLRLLILLIIPALLLVSCTEMPEPVVNNKYYVTSPISDQLTGFQKAADNLVKDAGVFAVSLDPIAKEMGEYLTSAGNAMDTASYYLNIAKEAEVTVTDAVTVYKYAIFTWSAAGGEHSENVEYRVTANTDNTVHEVILGGTKIIEATMDNAAEFESGILNLSFSGNTGSPDYVYEWTQHDVEKASVKVDSKSGAEPSIVEQLVNADNTISLNVQKSAKTVFSSKSNEEGLKGTYEKYDASGNVEESGTWDLLREDLSIVTLSIIDLYKPISAIRDSLGALANSGDSVANLAWMHFGGSIVSELGRYASFYTPPPDATTSSEPIEGERWSLVYYWSDLAYQVSTTPETYYHIVYQKNGEAWDTLCYAEDSKTMRSAEMFFVKDTLDIWDFTTHFTLGKEQGGSSDLLHLVAPTFQATPPGWQDYILTFNPETLAASDWRQIFNNSFGPFEWRVGNWTAGAATGYWEEWGWGPHGIKATFNWPY